MPVRLAGDGATDPAWSPDGRWIAFVCELLPESHGKVGIFLIPATGGAERTIAEIYLALSGTETFPGYFCCGMSWHPDGKWLAIGGRHTPDSPAGLFLVSPETAEKRRLTVTKASMSSAFSPNGRKSSCSFG